MDGPFGVGSDVKILVFHMHAQQVLLLTGGEDPFRGCQPAAPLHTQFMDKVLVAARG